MMGPCGELLAREPQTREHREPEAEPAHQERRRCGRFERRSERDEQCNRERLVAAEPARQKAHACRGRSKHRNEACVLNRERMTNRSQRCRERCSIEEEDEQPPGAGPGKDPRVEDDVMRRARDRASKRLDSLEAAKASRNSLETSRGDRDGDHRRCDCSQERDDGA